MNKFKKMAAQVEVTLQKKNEGLQEKNEGLQEKNEGLQQKVEKLEKDAAAVEDKSRKDKDLGNELTKTKLKLTKMEQKLEDSQGAAEKTEAQMHSEVDRVKTQSEAATAHLQTENDDLKAELNRTHHDLQSRLDNAIGELDKAKQAAHEPHMCGHALHHENAEGLLQMFSRNGLGAKEALLRSNCEATIAKANSMQCEAIKEAEAAQIKDQVNMATEKIGNAVGTFRSTLERDLRPGNGVGLMNAIETLKDAQESRDKVGQFQLGCVRTVIALLTSCSF